MILLYTVHNKPLSYCSIADTNYSHDLSESQTTNNYDTVAWLERISCWIGLDGIDESNPKGCCVKMIENYLGMKLTNFTCEFSNLIHVHAVLVIPMAEQHLQTTITAMLTLIIYKLLRHTVTRNR